MKNILLLLANGFETYEASVFIDVFAWNFNEGDGTTKLFTCGIRKEIKSTFDLKIIVDFKIADIIVDNYDALAIPGGFEKYGFYEDAYNKVFIDLIRTFYKKIKL